MALLALFNELKWGLGGSLAGNQPEKHRVYNTETVTRGWTDSMSTVLSVLARQDQADIARHGKISSIVFLDAVSLQTSVWNIWKFLELLERHSVQMQVIIKQADFPIAPSSWMDKKNENGNDSWIMILPESYHTFRTPWKSLECVQSCA